MAQKMKPTQTLAVASLGAWVALTGSAFADQQILDDLIVVGSVCTGQDCSNGESFGFDTLRLKENNLRIHFQDTSTSASFPTSDWRIIANDSANGGASYLAFEDSDTGRIPFRVEANAPANTLHVDSAGRIGIKTASPVVDIHVVNGNTPTLRLEQDGSSGFTSQTYDLAANEANFFIRDVTNGSKLFFRAQPGAPQDSLYIDSAGEIGLGTNAPAANLHIRDTSDKTSSDPHLLVENLNTTAGNRTLLDLSNQGGAIIMTENRESGTRWALINANTGSGFRISDPDTAGLEFELSQAGDLNIKGDFVSNGTTLTVPDYVFADDYDLMPLKEVAAFIAQERHLPRIPSAADVSRDGLNVVQMQMALLEKVEELTLYTIALERQIDDLTAQVAQP